MKKNENNANDRIIMSEFKMYGLNRYRNFLKAPDCECEECGHKESGLLVAKDDETLFNICASLLKEHGCPLSAIFVVRNNGDQLIITNVPDDDEAVSICKIPVPNIHCFARYDGEKRLCCYSLLIEQDDGLWKNGY